MNVPDVARLDEASARATLEAAGLVVGAVTATDSPDVPAGAVMGTDPGANVPGGIPMGSTVNLLVSNGQVTVPDLTGQPLQAASATLQTLGLTTKTQLDPGCSGGTIAAQSVVGPVPQRSDVQLRACVP